VVEVAAVVFGQSVGVAEEESAAALHPQQPQLPIAFGTGILIDRFFLGSLLLGFNSLLAFYILQNFTLTAFFVFFIAFNGSSDGGARGGL
jgi:hypothetical protein